MVSYRPGRVMQLNLLKSKIHRAEVTDTSLNHEGSLDNGARFETHTIAAPARQSVG
jgi:aspartate 1-decarboxylase